MKRHQHQSNGFTIIEVVIVLALAAFIFTIVFFAVPQLSKSLTNRQRAQDLDVAASAVLDFKASNGRLPDGNSDRSQLQNIVGTEFLDNEGRTYIFWFVGSNNYYGTHSTGTNPGRDIIAVHLDAVCDASDPDGVIPNPDAGTQALAVKLHKEGSAGETSPSRINYFCRTVR